MSDRGYGSSSLCRPQCCVHASCKLTGGVGDNNGPSYSTFAFNGYRRTADLAPSPHSFWHGRVAYAPFQCFITVGKSGCSTDTSTSASAVDLHLSDPDKSYTSGCTSASPSIQCLSDHSAGKRFPAPTAWSDLIC
jgi:hypothetical protein